jgi:microcystin-dependent protein
LKELNESFSQKVSKYENEFSQKVSIFENEIAALKAYKPPVPVFDTSRIDQQLLILNGNTTFLKSSMTALESSIVPAGSIHWFATVNAPSGYLKLNGAVVSRNSFPKLWAHASSSGNLASSEGAKQSGQFGPGDGSTTFSLPDLRGVVLRGLDEGRGLDAGRVLGSYRADGLQTHSHETSENAHSHGVHDPGHEHSYTRSQGNQNDIREGSNSNLSRIRTMDYPGANTDRRTTGIWIYESKTYLQVLQSGNAPENRMKNVALLACIKF